MSAGIRMLIGIPIVFVAVLTTIITGFFGLRLLEPFQNEFSHLPIAEPVLGLVVASMIALVLIPILWYYVGPLRSERQTRRM